MAKPPQEMDSCLTLILRQICLCFVIFLSPLLVLSFLYIYIYIYKPQLLPLTYIYIFENPKKVMILFESFVTPSPLRIIKISKCYCFFFFQFFFFLGQKKVPYLGSSNKNRPLGPHKEEGSPKISRLSPTVLPNWAQKHIYLYKKYIYIYLPRPKINY